MGSLVRGRRRGASWTARTPMPGSPSRTRPGAPTASGCGGGRRWRCCGRSRRARRPRRPPCGRGRRPPVPRTHNKRTRPAAARCSTWWRKASTSSPAATWTTPAGRRIGAGSWTSRATPRNWPGAPTRLLDLPEGTPLAVVSRHWEGLQAALAEGSGVRPSEIPSLLRKDIALQTTEEGSQALRADPRSTRVPGALRGGAPGRPPLGAGTDFLITFAGRGGGSASEILRDLVAFPPDHGGFSREQACCAAPSPRAWPRRPITACSAVGVLP